jgi:O-antigen/teichoic acid export membrane protein
MHKNTSTVGNISYSAISKAIAFLFQAVANIVLSRELGSGDYGVVNFAMIQVTLMTTLANCGINNAVVQRKEFDESTLHTAFTIKFIFSVAVYAVIYAFADCSVYFFDDPHLVQVIKVLGLTMVINTLGFMPCTMLSRTLQLKKTVVAETANTIASSLIGIVMATHGFKFWSIVFAYTCSNALFVLIVNLLMPCRIRFHITPKVAKELIGYGWQVLLTSLLSFAVLNFDNFVVGSAKGAATLGYYSIAFNWGSMICGIMSSIVLSVIFPTFSRMQDDPAKVKEAYIEVIRYTAIFCVLWNLTLFCLADRFLVHVLGKGTDKWLPALNSLRILCAYGVVRCLVEPTNTLLMAGGNARLVVRASTVVALIEAFLVVPAIVYGSIEVVSAVVLFAYLCQVCLLRRYMGALYQLSFKSVLELILPVGGATVVVCALFFSLQKGLADSWLGMILAAVLISISYVVVYGVMTGWKPYCRLMSVVRS